MKPLLLRRFLLVYALTVFFGAIGFQSTAQNYSLYDNIEQLQARIKQAGNSTIVINFWATWCKPCVEELPCFEEFREKYAHQDIQVLLVSLDFRSQLEKKFIPFLNNQRLRSEVVLLADQDVNTWIPKIYEDWDGAIPATLVLKGDKRKFSLGKFDSLEDLHDFVQPFLPIAPDFMKPVSCGGK
ncbi:MAG: redoxin domain-containing protein [Saprospiraceae bacterium]|nr:redoxin domain-containing protein [Saprospiraceae bacterium]